MNGLQFSLVMLIFLAFAGILWGLRGLQKDVERHDGDIKELQDKAKKPSSLPYQTRDELEHAMAALIILDSELDFKKSLVENVAAHIKNARNPKVKQ